MIMVLVLLLILLSAGSAPKRRRVAVTLISCRDFEIWPFFSVGMLVKWVAFLSFFTLACG